MAKSKVTGYTREEVEEARSEWPDDSKPFDEVHCLAKIPNQPEDYSGPDRYCMLRRVHEIGDAYICYLHGGKGSTNPENTEKLAAMKHGMHATREHLVEDFDEKDQALYDWIVTEWPSAYDIDVSDDPSAAYDFHRLAAEIVRAERGRGFLIEEGEINEQEVYNEEGRLVVGEDGEVVTEKSQHYLADMMDKQDRKITKLEKELGITQKEQARQSSTDSAVEAIKSFSELGSSLIDRDDGDYDPESEPWSEDGSNEQDS